MYEINLQNIGRKIKEYRKAKNISVEELANTIGKSKATVNRYESGDVMLDIITAIEICNSLNINLNDICTNTIQSIEKETLINPFEKDIIYLYYISKNGLIISSLEIENKKYYNSVLMKNALKKNGYKQEYVGILENTYNTAFICLTNAINNPRTR